MLLTFQQEDGPEFRRAISEDWRQCVTGSSFWLVKDLIESAWFEHAPFAFWLTEVVRPRRFVELGTHTGFSYFAFCQAIQNLNIPASCHAVDTWHGDEHAGFYGEEVYARVNELNRRNYAGFSSLIRSRFEEALFHFADGSIDLLHIDGRHRYEDARDDFESWLPKLSNRGVVLFHDTNVRERDFGVWRIWSEVSKHYPSFEFTHGHGLGVLAVGSDVPPGLRPLLTSSVEQVASIRTAYAHLGQVVSRQWLFELQAAQLGARNQKVQAYEQKVQAYEEELAQLRGERAEQATLVDQLRGELAQLRTQNQQEIAALRARSSELQERLTEIQLSESWRITAPLRAVGARMPAASRFARRAAKLVWWSTTLQLPHRIAQRFDSGIPKQPDANDRAADYQKWIEAYDRLQPGEPQIIQAYVSKLPAQPKFSVIVPVYNTAVNVLHEMIASVKAQVYENWELCLADDASTESHTRKALERAASEDSRIKLIFCKTNGGISAASNAALELATGDYIALLDHDDVLASHALATMAVAINQHPDSDIFYSDEDKLDADGKRYDPYFKPDWNPELLYGQNFINHLGIYRTSLVRSIGGFRIGFEGSQDYDLILRAAAVTSKEIVHVPHVLYHWRLHPGAQTFSSMQLARATGAARRAIKEQLAGLGEDAEVVDGYASFHRVLRAPPMAWPRVSAIIPTRDHPDILAECLRGLINCTDYPDLEIIVADNGSVESETERLLSEMRQRGVRVVDCAGPFNYSKINNEAIRQAKGEILLLLNNDISMSEPGWLKEMVTYLLKPDVGAVGAKLFYPNGTVQHAGVALGIGGVAGHVHVGAAGNEPGYFGWLELARDVACVTAACMAVRRSMFERIGGLDEQNLKVAFNDVDLCMRIREAGYRIIWTPYARLTHHESTSRGADTSGEKRDRFQQEVLYMRAQWGNVLIHDPFWNPNLSLDSCEPALAFPPRRMLPWRQSTDIT